MGSLRQQGGDNGGQGGTTTSPFVATNSFSLGGNLTTQSGNLLIAIVSGTNSVSVPSSVTVSGAAFGTWTQAGGLYTNGLYWFTLWYVANCNSAAASTTISASIAFSGTQKVICSLALFELVGYATTSPYDVTSAGATGSSSTPNCGVINPSQAGDLIIASVTIGGSLVETAGSGYTLAWAAYDGVLNSNGYQYNLSAGSGSQTPAWGTSSTPTWVSIAWAFKAVAVTLRELCLLGAGT